jgi:hypothetical protein
MSIDFELPKGTASYNLYKLHPPFKKLVDGHGYPGVILERATDGRLQCHICGDWYEDLARHVQWQHRMKSAEYKNKFELRLKDVLLSRQIRKKLKEAATTPQNIERCRNNNKLCVARIKANKTKQTIVRAAASLKSKNTLAALNERGLCPDQVNYRFDIVAQEVGKTPTERDLRNFDGPLYDRIRFKFGTLTAYLGYRADMKENEAKEKLAGDFDESKINYDAHRKKTAMRKVSFAGMQAKDVFIVSGIRKIYREKGRVLPKYFNGTPSLTLVMERFGNLENALREAGIDAANWTMIG